MGEPKAFASLTSGLLARKGAAKPAMRRQYLGGGMGNLAVGHEDLGWNDMGEDLGHEPAPHQPHAGLSPMPASASPGSETPAPAPVSLMSESIEISPETAEVPPVVEQRQMLVEKVADGRIEEDEPAKPRPKAAATGKARNPKAAFTLRLDPERHLKLRLACAVANRSAQQLVVEALDELLEQWPQVEQLAGQVPERRAARQA